MNERLLYYKCGNGRLCRKSPQSHVSISAKKRRRTSANGFLRNTHNPSEKGGVYGRYERKNFDDGASVVRKRRLRSRLVSVIAGELGITKGALYRHYKNKRAIFEAIVERMYRLDAERSRRYEVPEETYESAPAAYENISMDSVRKFALAQYAFWTEDEFVRDFRKMLSLLRCTNVPWRSPPIGGNASPSPPTGEKPRSRNIVPCGGAGGGNAPLRKSNAAFAAFRRRQPHPIPVSSKLRLRSNAVRRSTRQQPRPTPSLELCQNEKK